MSINHDRPYYTPAEAAKLLAVSPSTIWRWIDERTLPAYRVGRRSIRIKKHDLETIIRPAKEASPVTGEREGASHVPEAAPRDIWAGYDPQRVRAALAESAGALSPGEATPLLEEVRDARGQDSPGRPA